MGKWVGVVERMVMSECVCVCVCVKVTVRLVLKSGCVCVCVCVCFKMGCGGDEKKHIKDSTL